MLATKESTPAFAKRECGGKGYNLYLMTREGLPVPEWIVIGKRYYEMFIAQGGLKQKIEDSLRQWEQGQISPAECSKRIENLFLSQKEDGKLLQAIQEGLKAIANPPSFSVRSSAADE